MRCRLAQSVISWCIEPTSWLRLMEWCIDVLVGVLSRHVGWRLLNDALTCWLCWINMLVDIYWCTEVLVGVLDRHIVWRLLTCALTSWLCRIDMLFDVYRCIDVLVGVLDWHANVCTVLLNAIVADQFLHLVIKRNKKKTTYSLHTPYYIHTFITKTLILL